MAWYDDITLLTQLNAVKSKPEATDLQTTLRLALVQERKFLYDFLSVAHNDDGSIKTVGSGALGTGAVGTTALADGSVTAVKLTTDAVETLKIKDANVTAAKLATDAVETAKIKDANVSAAKLATDAVETAKIKDLNVTSAKLAANAVTSGKLADGAVDTTARIANGIVTVGKLLGTDANPRIPVCYSTAANNKMLTIGGVMTAAVVGNVLELYHAGSGVATQANVAVLAEASSGASGATTAVAAGAAIASWLVRPTIAIVSADPSMVPPVAGSIFSLTGAGTFLFVIRAPAYSVGRHAVALVSDPSGTPTVVANGSLALANYGQQTDSMISAVLQQTATTSYQLRHWCEIANPTNGFGITNPGLTAISAQLATILIFKLI